MRTSWPTRSTEDLQRRRRRQMSHWSRLNQSALTTDNVISSGDLQRPATTLLSAGSSPTLVSQFVALSWPSV